jgi:hypothetical protein
MKRPALPVEVLHWLDRYVGTWEYDGQRYIVRRRADGRLAAKGSYYNVAPLNQLLATCCTCCVR